MIEFHNTKANPVDRVQAELNRISPNVRVLMGTPNSIRGRLRLWAERFRCGFPTRRSLEEYSANSKHSDRRKT